MKELQPWTIDYFEEKFEKPDPWKYFASPYEKIKYRRQLDIIQDRCPNPAKILEIGSAEGAQTLLLAETFPEAKITSIEISSKAIQRAEHNLEAHKNRLELINGDIAKCKQKLKDDYFDICVWSESVYYLGAQLPMIATYDLLGKIVGKLKARGLLIMANTIDLPEDVPESIVTKEPLINCFFGMLSALLAPVSRSVYIEEKLGRFYKYQIWAFER
jgi:trans-aconitate methyltransferase